MGDMHGIDSDVRFDFDGALSVARQLWSFADELADVARLRRELADMAMQDFTGVCAEQFAYRMNVEAASFNGGSGFIEGLRQDAAAIAVSWAYAMNEQNRRLYGRHMDTVKQHRNLLEQAQDWAFGDEARWGPAPDILPAPSGPGFGPTGYLARY